MSWFTRRKPPTVTLPFPPERLAVLGTIIIPFGVDRGLKLRQSDDDLESAVWDSEFLNSYVCGYPDYFDQRRPEIGAIIRYTLIKALWGDRDGSAQKRVDFFKARLLQEDKATLEVGLLAGVDGSHYFEALMDGSDADEDLITRNLILSLRMIKTFPSICVNQGNIK